MDWLALVIILSASTYRVGRFINLDTLITKIRGPLFRRMSRSKSGVVRWLLELLTCPWCVTIWLAAGHVLLADHLTDIPVPAPGFTILAIAAGSIVFWGHLDSDDDPNESEAKRRAALGEYDEDLR